MILIKHNSYHTIHILFRRFGKRGTIKLPSDLEGEYNSVSHKTQNIHMLGFRMIKRTDIRHIHVFRFILIFFSGRQNTTMEALDGTLRIKSILPLC